MLNNIEDGNDKAENPNMDADDGVNPDEMNEDYDPDEIDKEGDKQYQEDAPGLMDSSSSSSNSTKR